MRMAGKGRMRRRAGRRAARRAGREGRGRREGEREVEDMARHGDGCVSPLALPPLKGEYRRGYIVGDKRFTTEVTMIS